MAKQIFLFLFVTLLVALVSRCNGQTPTCACGLNEEYKCRRRCPPQLCAVLEVKFNCAEEECELGCYCKDGFLRAHANAPCRPFKECAEWKKNPITCGKNEEFKCKNSCPPETCLSLIAEFRCISDQSCQYRCACKSGFLREKSGSPCIPSKKCPPLPKNPEST